jgi:uncharacterized protein
MGSKKIKKIGVGMGLRRENMDALLEEQPSQIDCLEVAPENYIRSGGKIYRKFRQLAERYPILVHGLSLSVGSLHPLNKSYLKDLKGFLREIKAPWMTDHLCYASVMGKEFHDLLPLPLTWEAVRHVVPRVKRIQDYLEMPFGIENVSYYAPAGKGEMTEWEFVTEVAERADCSLLLDVNNTYVNSVNHRFDPFKYLAGVPLDRVIHVHVAGHTKMEDFLLDTHGAEVIHPVWKLFEYVAKRIDIPGVILERDNDLPPLGELIREVEIAKRIIRQKNAKSRTRVSRSSSALKPPKKLAEVRS